MELTAAKERTGKADAATIEATAQARKNDEAVFLGKTKVEAANNTIANLTGKFDAMQAPQGRSALDVKKALFEAS